MQLTYDSIPTQKIAINYRWLCEKFVPPAETFVSNVMDDFTTTSVVVVDSESIVSSRNESRSVVCI